MEYEDNTVKRFLDYLHNFVANIRPDDPLPVRAPSYKVTETEIDGQIIDIVNHYLNNRECPAYIRSYVAHQVWREIRNPLATNGQDDSDDEDFDGGFDDVIDHSNFNQNQTFEPMKLIQDVVTKANAIVINLSNTMSPEQVKALPKYLPVSQYAIKNTRRKMEDRHVIIQDLNTLYDLDYGYPHSFYAVFDGHAGLDAAVYSAAHLHQYLIQNPLYGMDPVAALKHAFAFTDTNFTKKAKKERLKGGTTAVVALIREKRLVVAWLGDSQALLVRKRKPVHIVQPHKPEKETEKKRIEEMGGCVVNIQGTWRVLGQLAVSRAIGDIDYKPFVSSECDIKSLEISGDEDFLILACDGLWDELGPDQAVNIVYSYLSQNECDTDGVGRCLVEAARAAGSEDNITAVVVFLRPVQTLMEEEAQRIQQGQVPEMMESMVLPQKDSLPPSINAIFSQPSNLNPETPAFTPLCQQNLPPTTNGFKHGVHHMPPDLISNATFPNESVAETVNIDDSDNDEIMVAEISAAQEKAPAQPTEEEVDAALAELDSLPEVAGETGDVDEDEDEGWAYYKMEPNTEAPKEDVISNSKETLPIATPNAEEIYTAKIDSPTGSLNGSNSPKAVEGFVTSVELNTPEESYNTNLAINQSTEYFNGGLMEQSSGPFSVYVSSTPEPDSIDAPPVQSQAEMNEPMEEVPVSAAPFTPSVEIVHAQSTVEVLTTPFTTEAEMETDIPDLMAQSVTADLPAEPFIASPDIALCRESSPTIVENVEETTRNFDELVNQAKEFEESFMGGAMETQSNFETLANTIPESTFFTEPELELNHQISQESSELIDQLRNSVNDVTSVVSGNKNDLFELSVDEDKNRFTQEITKAFNAPLDEMMESFHEDQNPIMEFVKSPKESNIIEENILDSERMLLDEDLIGSEKIVESPQEANILDSPIQIETGTIPEVELIQTESKTEEGIENISEDMEELVEFEKISEEMEELGEKVSEVAITEETKTVEIEKEVEEKSEVKEIVKEVVKKPTTAPRSSKAAPPKPSPRTLGSKVPSTKPSPRSTAPVTKKPAPSTTGAPKGAISKSSSTSRPLSTTGATARSRATTSTSTTMASRATSATTSRLAANKPLTSSSSTTRSKSTTATTSSRITSASAARTKTTSSTTTKPSTIPPTKTAPPKKPLSTTTRPMSARTSTAPKPSATTDTTKSPATTRPATTRPTSAPKTASSTMSRRVPSSITATSATTKPTTTAPAKKPLTTGTSTRPPVTNTGAAKSRLTASSTATTKDTKNTTNKMLSTNRSTGLTSKTTASKTSSTTAASKTTASRLTKTAKVPVTGAKSKVNEASKKEEKVTSSEENKIVEEESTVEVKEKVLEERVNEEVGITKEEMVAEASAQQEVVVNGNH